MSRSIRAVSILLGAVLALSLVVGTPTAATAASPAKSGTYKGTLLDDEGQAVKKEWVRFRVKDKSTVVRFRSRIWVQCYIPPLTYYQLPLVFKMPKAAIKKNKVDRSWEQEIELEDETETLKGRVQLRFRKQGKVTGRVSIDVANCASRLGDPPYWVKLRAKRT